MDKSIFSFICPLLCLLSLFSEEAFESFCLLLICSLWRAENYSWLWSADVPTRIMRALAHKSWEIKLLIFYKKFNSIGQILSGTGI